MGVVLALLSALSYGISDVIGGLAARRAPFLRVALIGQAGGLGTTAILMLLLPTPAVQSGDLLWGAGSGVGTGLAMVFLFRGMGRGSMSVVVPLSAVAGVALPVAFSVALLGERPSWLTWAGIALAMPALWLICRRGDGSGGGGGVSAVDGLAAGGGIAVQYVCLAQASASSGLWPILSGRVAALALILAATALMGDAGTGRGLGGVGSALALGIGAGALAAAALSAYLYALTTEFVTVTVVLSSLYPVVPVVAGILLLHERLRWVQTIGLLGALAATVTIAVGQ